MGLNTKQYPIESVLARADQLGIVLYVAGGELCMEAAPGTLTEERRAAILRYKDALLAVVPREICSVCLDAGLEVSAVGTGPNGLMHCQKHRPQQIVLW